MTARIMKINIIQYAAAAPNRLASTCDNMETVIKFQLTDTRKITALIDVIERTKE